MSAAAFMVVGVGDEATGSRSWIWAVAAGLLLSGVLLAHAGWRAYCALPEQVRVASASALRRHPRLLAIQLGIALWTLVLAMYNLAYPGAPLSLSSAETVAPHPAAETRPQPLPLLTTTPRPLSAPSPLQTSFTVATPNGGAAPVESTAPFAEATTRPSSSSPPTPGAPLPSPSPQPCQVQPATDVLRQLDGAATTLTGRPLGSEAAAVAEGAAGCTSPSPAWAKAVVAAAVAARENVGSSARCGDVIGQLEVLRYITPMTHLRVLFVDAAISDVTAACARIGRNQR